MKKIFYINNRPRPSLRGGTTKQSRSWWYKPLDCRAALAKTERFVKKVVIWLIRKYQKILSPDTGIPHKLGLSRGVCVFYPTCSEYMIQAVEKYGVVLGLVKGARRILRCHPWQKNHIDPLT
jgi:hypothetical protein